MATTENFSIPPRTPPITITSVIAIKITVKIELVTGLVKKPTKKSAGACPATPCGEPKISKKFATI